MNKYTVVLFAAVLPLLASTGQAAGPAFWDDFDAYPVGQTFTSPLNGWQASDTSVIATNDPVQSAPRSVVVPRAAALTNTIIGPSGPVIWTDCYWKPVAGDLPSDLPLSTASFAAYCNPSGYVQVATASGWITCSNDIWGGAINPVGSGFARVSVYQDYGSSNAAVFVDGHLAVQDLPFVGSAGAYHTFTLASQSSNLWADNVWIKTNYDSATLTNDLNADGLADAAEVMNYGYAARTLYIGAGSGSPLYGTFAAALAVARARDTLYVYSGPFSEDVVVSNSFVFGGVAFTNSGTLTIRSGSSPSFQNATTWGTVSIDTNASVTFQAVTCTNLTVSDNSSITALGAVQAVNSVVLGTNVTAGFSNTVTATSLVIGTNSAATFAQAVSCSNLVIRSGATVTLQSLTCSNLVIESGAHVTCAGDFNCSLSCSVDTTATLGLSGTVSCPGTMAVAATGAVTMNQAGTVGTLNCTGSLAFASSQSLTVATISLPGVVTVSGGGTATVSTALSLPAGGHLEFADGRFVYTPLSADLSGTFSISNGWGTASNVWISAGGSATFNQALACNGLTVYAGATGTVQALTCASLTTQDGTMFTALGSVGSAGAVALGQNAGASFADTVETPSVMVGTNTTATFSGAVGCSSLVVRAGATVVVQSLTCSNLVVEPGAHFTCLGAFSGTVACSIGQNAVATFNGSVTAGTFTVADGATVSFSQGATLGSLTADGTVSLGAGTTLTVNSASVSGNVQVSGGGTMTVNTSMSVTNSGLLTFSASRLVVPSSSVDMSGTFTINNTWGQPAPSAALPFTDSFETYNDGARISDFSFLGWGASATNVVVQTGEANPANGGSKALSLPSATLVSNRISTTVKKIWTDFYVMPTLGGAPFSPQTNNAGFVAFVDTNGWLEVATSNGWDVCSNLVSGGQPDPMTTSSWTRVTVCQNLTNNTVAVFVNGKLVRQQLKAPGPVPSTYTSFAFDNADGQAYLDDVAIGEPWPASLTTDLDHDYAADAYEVDVTGSVTARNDLGTRGTIYTLR